MTVGVTENRVLDSASGGVTVRDACFGMTSLNARIEASYGKRRHGRHGVTLRNELGSRSGVNSSPRTQKRRFPCPFTIDVAREALCSEVHGHWDDPFLLPYKENLN